jgi:hypothetical protein
MYLAQIAEDSKKIPKKDRKHFLLSGIILTFDP